MSDITLAPRRRPLWRLFHHARPAAVRRGGAGARSGSMPHRRSGVAADAWRARRRNRAGFTIAPGVRWPASRSGSKCAAMAPASRCNSQTAGQAATQIPITAQLGEILVVAQVYDPKLLIAEFTGPATISDAGGSPSMSVNWSKARSSVVGLPQFRAGLDRVRRSRESIASMGRRRRRWRGPNISNCTGVSPKARRPTIR